jgi:hypothetical protein
VCIFIGILVHVYGIYTVVCDYICRSRRPCGLRRGSAADRLLGLRVRTHRGDGCLCLLYNKDKRQSQDNQDKAVQIKYRDRKKKRFRWWHRISCGLFVVCCVGSGLYDKMIICWEESYRVLIENADLGRILGFKAEEATDGWHKFLDERSNSLRYLPNITEEQNYEVFMKRTCSVLFYC